MRALSGRARRALRARRTALRRQLGASPQHGVVVAQADVLCRTEFFHPFIHTPNSVWWESSRSYFCALFMTNLSACIPPSSITITLRIRKHTLELHRTGTVKHEADLVGFRRRGPWQFPAIRSILPACELGVLLSYIYIYICVCIYIYIYVYTYIHTLSYIHIYIYIYTCYVIVYSLYHIIVCYIML